MLPDPFRGMGERRNSTEAQQSGHIQRFGSEVKNGRSSAKDGAAERLRYETIQVMESPPSPEGCGRNSGITSRPARISGRSKLTRNPRNRSIGTTALCFKKQRRFIINETLFINLLFYISSHSIKTVPITSQSTRPHMAWPPVRSNLWTLCKILYGNTRIMGYSAIKSNIR